MDCLLETRFRKMYYPKGLITCVFCLFALTSSLSYGQGAPLGDGRGPSGGGAQVPVDPNAGKWNLTEMDELYKEGIQLLSDEKYPEAYDFFTKKKKELKKQGGKEVREPKKKVAFLTNLAKELVGVQKLVTKPSEESLARAIQATNKYRTTFVVFKFLKLEEELRALLGETIINFEYPPYFYKTNTDPLDPFAPFDLALKVKSPYRITTDLKIVPQGRACYAWKDTPELRSLSAYFPLNEASWEPFRYLCFKAKLADPKAATLQVYISTDQSNQNRYELGCGTWKGWKDFRINFRKEASVDRPNSHAEMSWKKLYAIGYFTRGGLSDFYVDDIRLTTK